MQNVGETRKVEQRRAVRAMDEKEKIDSPRGRKFSVAILRKRRLIRGGQEGKCSTEPNTRTLLALVVSTMVRLVRWAAEIYRLRPPSQQHVASLVLASFTLVVPRVGCVSGRSQSVKRM